MLHYSIDYNIACPPAFVNDNGENVRSQLDATTARPFHNLAEGGHADRTFFLQASEDHLVLCIGVLERIWKCRVEVRQTEVLADANLVSL